MNIRTVTSPQVCRGGSGRPGLSPTVRGAAPVSRLSCEANNPHHRKVRPGSSARAESPHAAIDHWRYSSSLKEVNGAG